MQYKLTGFPWIFAKGSLFAPPYSEKWGHYKYEDYKILTLMEFCFVKHMDK